MTGAVECRYYGRDFTADEMALLRALIADPAPLSRRALSIEFCRRIGWLKPDGGLKDMMARVTMLAMHRDGIIELPPPRWQRGRPKPIVFRLEDGKTLDLGKGDPQLRHLDHAWASTVHAFQGRTVDNVIAAMEARHPHLTTQKGFYVEISRARDRAELVTDDAAELRDRLQEATGERIAALEGIGEMKRDAPEKVAEAARTPGTGRERGPGEGAGKAPDRAKTPAKEPDTLVRERGKGGMDLGL